MQAIDEQSIRRESFTQGESFLGKDFQTWYIPQLDHVTLSQSEPLRTYIRHKKTLDGLDPHEYCKELLLGCERTRLVLLDLLNLNYVLTDEQAEAILGPEIHKNQAIDWVVLTPIVLGNKAISDAISLLDAGSQVCIHTDHGYN